MDTLSCMDTLFAAPEDGAQGDSGPSIFFAGDWSSAVNYVLNSEFRPYVRYNNKYYLRKGDFENCIGINPLDDAQGDNLYWSYTAEQSLILARKIQANEIDVSNLIASFVGVNKLKASNIDVANLVANIIGVNKLTANNIDVSSLVASFIGSKQLTADNINVANLIASFVDVNKLKASNIDVSNLIASFVDVNKLKASNIDVSNLIASFVDADRIKASNIDGKNLEVEKVNVSDYDAVPITTLNEFGDGALMFYYGGVKRMRILGASDFVGAEIYKQNGDFSKRLDFEGEWQSLVADRWKFLNIALYKFSSAVYTAADRVPSNGYDSIKVDTVFQKITGNIFEYVVGNVSDAYIAYDGKRILTQNGEPTTTPDSTSGSLQGLYTFAGGPSEDRDGHYIRTVFSYYAGKLQFTAEVQWGEINI